MSAIMPSFDRVRVSAACGCSVTTVSRYLTGLSVQPISAHRIEGALRELGMEKHIRTSGAGSEGGAANAP